MPPLSESPPTPTQTSLPSRFAETFRMVERINRYRVVLRRYWWLLPACLAMALGLASWFGSKLPPLYQSKAKIWLRGRLTLSEGRDFNEELSSQIALLQSLTVYQGTLERLRQRNPGWDFPTNTPVNTAPLFRLSVKEVPKAGVFELRATGAHPAATQGFLDALMEEYLEFKRRERLQTSDAAQGSFYQQLQILERQIYETQEKARKFQIDNQLLVYQEQGSSAAAYLARINRQLTALRSEYQLIGMLNADQVAEIASRWMDESATETLPGQNVSREFLQTMAGPLVDSYRASQQLVLLKAKRDELAQFLRPEHPKMVRLGRLIADQEKILGVFEQESARRLQNRKAMIELQIKSLEAAYKEWESKAAEASTKIAEHDRIQQEIRRLQSFYDRLAGAVQTVDVSKNLEQESFGILDRASPAAPINRQLKFQLVGLVVGLFLGLGLLYLVEQFDDRFTSIAELRSLLNETVLGEIPDQPRPRKLVPLIQPEDKRHEFVEGFAMIRSGLAFSFPGRELPRAIVVTSAVAQEGKSTVAANLAVSLAMGGSRVLLVDADLRRAVLHDHFGLPQQPGLSELLERRAKSEPATSGGPVLYAQPADLIRSELNSAGLVQTSSVPNVWLLTAGLVRPKPGAQFLKDRLQHLIRELAEQFDFVIIDSAPVLVADDTGSLAPLVDGVLFVVRGSFTSARVANAALDVLRQRQVKILGLIFNRAPRTMGKPYYKYYHEKR